MNLETANLLLLAGATVSTLFLFLSVVGFRDTERRDIRRQSQQQRLVELYVYANRLRAKRPDEVEL